DVQGNPLQIVLSGSADGDDIRFRHRICGPASSLAIRARSCSSWLSFYHRATQNARSTPRSPDRPDRSGISGSASCPATRVSALLWLPSPKTRLTDSAGSCRFLPPFTILAKSYPAPTCFISEVGGSNEGQGTEQNRYLW